MDLKWSYYLIVALYAVLFVLKYLNQHEESRFNKENPNSVRYIGYKKDFFTTIAWCCGVATVLINGAAIFVGKPFVWHAVVITLAIIGMSYFSRSIKIIATPEGHVLVGGTLIKKEEIKEVKIIEKSKCTWYHVDFVKTIAGYDGVAFSLKQNQQAFTNYIQ